MSDGPSDARSEMEEGGWEIGNDKAIPMVRRAVTFKSNLTACTFGIFDAREQIANELRRIADLIEQGDTLSESGNMGTCDYGSWEIQDPWET